MSTLRLLFPTYRQVVISFLSLVVPLVSAQDFYSFNQVSVKDGLSSQTQITSIVEDALGTYWFGTHKGLNRLVGKEIIVYSNVPGNSTTLLDDNVEDLFIDDEGRLWVITTSGTCIFDHQQNHFVPVSYENEIPVFTAYLKEPGGVVLASNNKVYRYLYDTRTLEQFFELEQDFPIYRMQKIGAHDYLLASFDHGFLTYDHQKGLAEVPFTVSSTIVPQTVLVDSHDRIWFSLYNEGLFCYQYGRSSSTLLNVYNTRNSALNNNAVIDLIEKDNKIWIATDGGGINILDVNQNSFSYINHERGYSASMPINAVRRLYDDLNGNLWAGTVRGGVIEIRPTRIRSYENVPFGSHSGLSDNTVMALCQDEYNDNTVWIGTDGGGINKLNLETGDFTHFATTEGKKINAVVNYSESELLISIFIEGVFMFNKNSGALTPFTIIDDQTNERIVGERDFITFSRTPGGDIRFFGNVLCEFSEDGSFRFYDYDSVNAPGSFVFDATVTSLKTIVYDMYTIFEIYHDRLVLSPIYRNEQPINAVALDGRDNLWISDRNGLKRVDVATGKGDYIDMPLNAEISSLVTDTKNRIWAGTNKGLLMYDFEKERFYIYDRPDGVIPNEYLSHAVLTTKNGDLFMGGNNGLIHVKADIVSPEVVVQPITLFSYNLNDETRYNVDRSGNTPLAIPWNFKSFALKATVRDFTMFSNQSFRFDIIGNSSSSTVESNNGNLSLTTLTPGQYSIHASYRMPNGEFSPPAFLTRVTVSQPWWKSWWMIVIEVAFIASISLALLAFYFHRKKEKLKWTMKEHEQKLAEEKVQFLINISHELRTPLTLIYTPIKRLSEINTMTVSENRVLKKILVQVQNIVQLVNMVLDVRKMEVGGAALYVEEVSLNSWIKDIAENFRDEFESKGIALNYEFDSTIANLNIDDKKTEIVLNNLLMNALKYSYPDTEVVITTKLKSGVVQIAVSDEGMVISEADIHKVFNRFYQTSNRNKGYGIGLSYAKMLIEMQKGEIGVNNNNGKGATFFIELPVNLTPSIENVEKRSYLNELIHVSSLENTEDKEFDLSTRSILFIDDDQEILELLNTTYSSKFKHIYNAGNGAEGLEIIKEKHPGIVVSDVMMPEMDGFELCQTLKSDIDISHVPIILLTAKSDLQSTAIGYKLGADSYIPKPFDLNFLLIVIRNILKNREDIKNRYSFNPERILPEDTTFSKADEDFMKKLNQYIIENIDSTLTSDVIAEYMGMSRTVFYEKMKAITNIGINKYVTQLKIKHAIDLLNRNEMRISEVAYAVGYNDPGYFSTVFKQVTGKTPREFQKA